MAQQAQLAQGRATTQRVCGTRAREQTPPPPPRALASRPWLPGPGFRPTTGTGHIIPTALPSPVSRHVSSKAPSHTSFSFLTDPLPPATFAWSTVLQTWNRAHRTPKTSSVDLDFGDTDSATTKPALSQMTTHMLGAEELGVALAPGDWAGLGGDGNCADRLFKLQSILAIFLGA